MRLDQPVGGPHVCRVSARADTLLASAKDRREIRSAVKRSPLTSAVDPSGYRVRDIRLDSIGSCQ